MYSVPALILPGPSPLAGACSALHFVEARTQPGLGPLGWRGGSWMLLRHETLQRLPASCIINFPYQLPVVSERAQTSVSAPP